MCITCWPTFCCWQVIRVPGQADQLSWQHCSDAVMLPGPSSSCSLLPDCCLPPAALQVAVPNDRRYHAVATEAIITNKMVHHLLLFACRGEAAPQVAGLQLPGAARLPGAGQSHVPGEHAHHASQPVPLWPWCQPCTWSNLPHSRSDSDMHVHD